MCEQSEYQLISPRSGRESQDLLAGKPRTVALQRVQALLADWLRMENVVVLTAAGCSVAAGGRLMAGPRSNNLECLVLDAIELCDLRPRIASIIRHRKSTWPECKESGPSGFEDWLSYLFNASVLTQSDNSPVESVTWKGDSSLGDGLPLTLTDDDLATVRKLVERAIFAECALQIDHREFSITSGSPSSGHLSFLAKLVARDAKLGRTHLFTLNYDTLFEQAIEELGIQYFDGFSGKANSRFDPAVYGLDIHYPGDVSEGRVRRFDKLLQYYKLHGSLHWYIGHDGMYRARHRNLSFVSAYRDLTPEEKAEKLKSTDFCKINSFGILPTSKKLTQTLDAPYAHLFRLFHVRLNQPQTFLLVIGYGFGDEHVNHIIESSLKNPSLVMLVVEPNPRESIMKRIDRYQSLGQRAFILTKRCSEDENGQSNRATFADFALNIMPDVKWLDDYRRMRVFEEEINKLDGSK